MSCRLASDRGSRMTFSVDVRQSPSALSLTVYVTGTARGAIVAAANGLEALGSSGSFSDDLWRRSQHARFRPCLALSLLPPLSVSRAVL